jgi:bacterioferritin-associated ferredoxin
VFVCHCEVVTDREIARAVDDGADTVQAVGFETGAGTGCGGCHESIEAIIADRCGACPRRPVLAVA